jgi:D-alanyl-D-alanine carboxypeptidase
VNAFGIPADYGAKRRLAPQAEATELVSVVSECEGGEIRLHPEAAAAWKKMKDTASGEGILLLAVSGFRSIERQWEIIQRKQEAGASTEDILRTVAAPGYSEHHTGRAIDVGAPEEALLTEAFARTPAFRWLEAHAGEFGFKLSYPPGNVHGFVYEPWHWCFHRNM